MPRPNRRAVLTALGLVSILAVGVRVGLIVGSYRAQWQARHELESLGFKIHSQQTFVSRILGRWFDDVVIVYGFKPEKPRIIPTFSELLDRVETLSLGDPRPEEDGPKPAEEEEDERPKPAEESDYDIRPLAAFPRLRILSLDWTISDRDLVHISNLRNLEDLNLSNTGIGDEGLSHIASLSKLKNLRCNDTRVGDAGLTSLVGLSRLEVLELSETRVTDVGLAHLSGLSRLTRLDLTSTRVTGAGLKYLAGLPQLAQLDLVHTQTGDAGLESLLAVKSLRYLSLRETNVTDGGVENLMKMTWLSGLDISPQIGPECLKVLRDLLPETNVQVNSIPSSLDQRPHAIESTPSQVERIGLPE